MRRSFMTAAAILLCLILSMSWEQVSCAKRKKRVRDPNKVWISVLGGPSYTPEASLGVGGAMLMSFKMDKKDTVSQRSFLPVGFNLSLNGTVVVAGAGTFFFNRDKYRLYMNYSFRLTDISDFPKALKEIRESFEKANAPFISNSLGILSNDIM